MAGIRAKIAVLRTLIAITHAHGVATTALIRRASGKAKARLIKHELMLEALNTQRRARVAELERQLKARPSGHVVMYDSIDLGQVPSNCPAVAGYTSGNWPTYAEMVRRFPKAHHLSIAVNSAHDADCLDIETGDATPGEAPAWVRRQHSRGIRRPVVYANTSTMPAVLAALAANGITRNQYRVWTAHYTYQPHIEPGSDATQWTDKALGRNLDESLCAPGFFG